MSEQEPVLEQCDYMHLHEKVIEQVQEEMPEEEILYDLAELFKVFGDSTRIKILYVLFQSEMCVCDIAQLFEYESVRHISSIGGYLSKRSLLSTAEREKQYFIRWLTLT